MKYKYLKSKTRILLTISLLILSACATNKNRDTKIVESLELQNAIIEATITNRSNYELPADIKESSEFSEQESSLRKSLRSIQNSNNAVIEKLKPTKQKGYKCGKNERDRYGR